MAKEGDRLCAVADKNVQWHTLDRLLYGANDGNDYGRNRYIGALRKLSAKTIRQLMLEC